MKLVRSVADFAARHPYYSSLVLGAVAATGFPPLALWPVALAAMAAFAFVVREAPSRRSAFLHGWLFGAAHFTLANNWIATAFTHQAQMPAFLGWVAVPLLALYLAIYPALAALGAWWIAGRGRWWRYALAFAACWTMTEWLRSWVFTGYPWDPLGLILLGSWDRPGLAALLPWFGTYALSGLTVLVAVTLLVLWRERRLAMLGALALLLTVGMYWPAGKGEEGTLAYSLIQPNLSQRDINDPSRFEETFGRIARLTAPRDRAGRRLVLWPESGVPDYLEGGYPQHYYTRMTAGGDPAYARWRIGQVIGPGAMLLTGAVNLEIENGRAVGAYNSVMALTGSGEIVGRYDKAHLVPYGEYLPLRGLLEPLGLSRLVAGALDFIPGPGPRTLDLGPWGEAGIQICYEIVFSGRTVDPADRPDYIFNPSNDGWFGAWGPPQHLAQARMRALEEGLPVLRSTTTGISAVIDARGVVRQHIGTGVAGRIGGNVPPAFEPTLFAQMGNWLPLGWALLALLAIAVAQARSRR